MNTTTKPFATIHTGLIVLALCLLTSVVAIPVEAQVTGDSFDIAYGDTVADGVPGPGAGNIEVGGTEDSYSFDAVAGDVAIFDRLTASATFLWMLETPSGDVLFNVLYADRTAELAETGTYRLTVRGSTSSGVGTYSFRLLLTPPAQDFTIALGDTVSEGVPGPGAGSVEEPGAVDRYLFDADSGDVAIIDTLAGPTSGLRLILEAPDGTELLNVIYTDREIPLPQDGTYTLTVSGLTITGVGTYSFQLVEVPPQVDEFIIAIDDTVSNGVPEPGAGNIENLGGVDRYAFDAAAGLVADFDAIDAPTSGLHWELHAPDGSELFEGIFSDRQATLPQNGTYTVTVSGLTVTSFGTYSFQIREAPTNTDPVAVDDEAETSFDMAITVDVLANDHDPDGDPLAVDSVNQPANGSTTTDGTLVTYTPDAGFTGTDSFSYTVIDGQGGTAQASVTVVVHPPPNRPPSVEDIPDQENTVGDTASLQVQGSDPDGDQLTHSATGLPPGLDIDSDTGEITGTIAGGADTASPYTVEVGVTDPDGATGTTTTFQWVIDPVDPGRVEVNIDILGPCLFINGFGVIPVVIYGNEQIDGHDIDLSTVELEGMPVQRIFRWYAGSVRDYNHDGVEDVLALIDEVKGAIPPGVSTATLTGKLFDGTEFAGSDQVCVHNPWTRIH